MNTPPSGITTPDSTGVMRDIGRTASGWVIRLTDTDEITLMGAEWIPLPLTASATESVARTFVARQVR